MDLFNSFHIPYIDFLCRSGIILSVFYFCVCVGTTCLLLTITFGLTFSVLSIKDYLIQIIFVAVFFINIFFFFLFTFTYLYLSNYLWRGLFAYLLDYLQINPFSYLQNKFFFIIIILEKILEGLMFFHAPFIIIYLALL